ncbi:hypothetical protein FSC37_22340 [Piscinibacter aquaticus]|uniref:IstB-like ATP-binding domain-containing protein n=1 Tax=Piscinibacter aquaticus TaxID=392597 RepID=A0A5C6TPE5_9BURK|nr:hypothetical protein FSC37_22340 [Piscinibacter aquaticus]
MRSHRARLQHTPFVPDTGLVTQLAQAQVEGRLEEKLLHFGKPKLLIVGELGNLPVEASAANLFFRSSAAPTSVPRRW